MEIITNHENINNCAVALGNFDGMHTAHRKIIAECISYAKRNNLRSGVLLFDTHTGSVVSGEPQKLLTTIEEKMQKISELGADFVYIKTFDKEMMQMSAEDFFDFLVNKIGAKAVFAGDDYTFGHRASGNSGLLSALGKKAGIHVGIINEISIDKKRISSTAVREFVRRGEMRKVQKYLGDMYSVRGRIVRGKQNGRKMGFPTANIAYSKDKLIPSDGVYAGVIKIDNQSHKCIVNVGKNPTFDAEKRTVEAHIQNFSENIYKKKAEVFFERRIRGEKKFSSADELTEQIKKDLENL